MAHVLEKVFGLDDETLDVFLRGAAIGFLSGIATFMTYRYLSAKYRERGEQQSEEFDLSPLEPNANESNQLPRVFEENEQCPAADPLLEDRTSGEQLEESNESQGSYSAKPTVPCALGVDKPEVIVPIIPQAASKDLSRSSSSASTLKSELSSSDSLFVAAPQNGTAKSSLSEESGGSSQPTKPHSTDASAPHPSAKNGTAPSRDTTPTQTILASASETTSIAGRSTDPAVSEHQSEESRQHLKLHSSAPHPSAKNRTAPSRDTPTQTSLASASETTGIAGRSTDPAVSELSEESRRQIKPHSAHASAPHLSAKNGTSTPCDTPTKTSLASAKTAPGPSSSSDRAPGKERKESSPQMKSPSADAPPPPYLSEDPVHHRGIRPSRGQQRPSSRRSNTPKRDRHSHRH